MKFRKKPVVIDSIQWTGDNEHEIYRFVGRNLRVSRPPSNYEHDNNVSNDIVNIFIPTLEGEMKANRFDWIIKGVQGECYPCKPDIFEKTYELVLEEYAAQKQSPVTAVEQLESAEKKPNRLGEFVGAIPDFFIDESPQEGGTVEAEEVLDKFVFFPQYIKDDVIPAMTEYASQVSATDKKRIEELEFGYNEAIRQAGNAQDTLIKRIEELEAENEILKMENSHSKLVVDEAKREIDRLRIDNMAHEFDQAEGEKFAPEYEKQIREDEAEKWKKEVERLRGLVERNWTDDLVIHFTSNIILGNTNGKLLGEYMKEFKANNNLLTAYGHK